MEKDAKSPLLSVINKTSFFDVFSEAEKKKIVYMTGMFKSYEQKGLTIFSEGEKGDSLFIVLSGTINITKLTNPLNQKSNTSPEEQEHTVIAKMESGDIFGEVAMLTGKTRITSAITQSTKNILLEINQEGMCKWNHIIQNKFHKQLLLMLIKKLDSSNRQYIALNKNHSK
jgi:CRP-like cAMP-binding protein